jgi:hypothetical protein
LPEINPWLVSCAVDSVDKELGSGVVDRKAEEGAIWADRDRRQRSEAPQITPILQRINGAGH